MPLRAGDRRREDDDRARRNGRRHPAQRLLPQGGGRHARAASPAFSGASPTSISSATATSSEALARIAAKNHRNGVENPYAQLRKDLGFEFCNTVSEKNPIVAGPLRRTDCSLVSDGAAAVVLTDDGTARDFDKAVRIRTLVQVNDYLPMSKRDIVAFEGCGEAWRRAHHQAEDRARRPRFRRDARLLHHRRADRIRGDGADARPARAIAPSRRAGSRRAGGCR